jgi:hypothetical protein
MTVDGRLNPIAFVGQSTPQELEDAFLILDD